MRKLVLLLCGILLLWGQLLAQTRTISGRVVDADGKPIPNASVIVKGSSQGASTNSEGVFSLSVPTGTTRLVVSAVGMTTQELARVMGGLKPGSESEQERRTGLGIPLARQLIEGHDGTLEIVSRKGAGTSATIRLP